MKAFCFNASHNGRQSHNINIADKLLSLINCSKCNNENGVLKNMNCEILMPLTWQG